VGKSSGEKDYCAIGRKYAEQVVSGEIPACRWVKLACQRQLDDLARKGWEWKFDKSRANRVCLFLEQLPHIKGRWKSPTLVLEPHQCFRLTTIFGWIDKDGHRRFRKALIVLPRKNAKTTEAAGIELYMLALDGEPGAEVYSAATTRDQAKISWDIAKRMAQKLPDFCERYGVKPLAHSISIESEAAFCKPLSRDADSLEGLNPSAAIIDELHAHKTREVFDVLDEATGARQQPLIYIISTEGDNAAGVFAEQVSYAQQILEGNHDDDSYFGIIYTIDPEDDWTSPESWRKANPNLGVSVFEKDIELRCRQAQKNAESQSSFLTKRLNVRVGAGDAYFNLLSWTTICKDESLKIEDFYGRECIIGLDFASKQDLAAKILMFDGDTVFAKFYLPEDAVDRGNPNYDLYRGWATRGVLTLTPGNVIDYEFIERDLLEDTKNFHVTEVGFDPHDATQFHTRMEKEGVPMVEVPQTVPSLSLPMKELAARIVAGRIRHDGNPLLGWCIGNTIAKVDAKENVFPRKAQAVNKIDGAVALIIAESRKIRAEDQTISYTGLRVIG
jgi:phage terminase large subunit-like protein